MDSARILQQLEILYPPGQAAETAGKISLLLSSYRPPAPLSPLTEKDALLITYGGALRQPGQFPLQTLQAFLEKHAAGAFSAVHILPFYPSSSDDGFAVIDYRRVDPSLGSWEDIARLRRKYRLMFDGVINHVSASSEWFRQFRAGEAPYRSYFITPGEDWDLSQVARPRTLPLLTGVDTVGGRRQVWTTFSPDQVDLNYANPAVLLEMLALILFYVEQGASLIRLDAVAYLWKEPGTTCLHLPQTHAVIRLLRAVLDQVAPWVLLVTETNVPHAENISYFGNFDPASGRSDEAQVVYQFPLAPLVLDAFARQDASRLSAWAASLEGPGLFLNFLASHDGIGVMPARGILSAAEIEALAQRCLAHGGQVSYRSNPDGSQSPYELNITLIDALNDPVRPDALDIPRFLAAQAVMLSLAGLPGVYTASLFGSRNWQEGVRQTGRARTINRMPYEVEELEHSLADPGSREARIFNNYLHMLRVRASQPAFHPAGGQQVLGAGAGIFALQRTPPAGGQAVVCLVNITPLPQQAVLKDDSYRKGWKDLLSGEAVGKEVLFKPYQALWLV